jgi:TRAP transporter TAXI family solute receptor
MFATPQKPKIQFATRPIWVASAPSFQLYRKLYWLLLNAFLALLLVTGHAPAQTYGIASMQAGTVAHTTAVAMAKVLKEKADINVLVQPMAGESVIFPLVDKGEVHFGISNAIEVIESTSKSNLRLVGAVHPLRLAIFAKKDGIKTFADLKGKRMPAGYSAVRTAETIRLALLAAGGISPKDIQSIPVPNVIRGADIFASGDADAFLLAFGAPKLREVHARVGVQPLEIPDTPSAIAASRKIFQYGYLTEVKPGPIFTGLDRPTKVYTVDYMMFTHAKVADELVYRVIETLVANKAELVNIAPHLREFSSTGLRKKYPVSYHPGALKYFAEHNIPAIELD